MKRILSLLLGLAFTMGVQAQPLSNLRGAPSWLINNGNGDMSAVGDAEIVNKDIGLARAEALAWARYEFAREFEKKYLNILKNEKYEVEIDRADIINIVRKSMTAALLEAKLTDTWITNDGSRIFVLIELDAEAKKKIEAKWKKLDTLLKLESDQE